MMCFRCFRGLKNWKEMDGYVRVEIVNSKRERDGYTLCPACRSELKEWLYGKDIDYRPDDQKLSGL